MLNIVLIILKVTGCILLSIVLLLLLILLSVLFVPIRYKVIGSKEDEIKGLVKITWLLHFISISASYEKQLEYGLKVAGFTLFSDKEKPEKPEKQKKPAKSKKPGRKQKPKTKIKNDSIIPEENINKETEQYSEEEISIVKPLSTITKAEEISREEISTTENISQKQSSQESETEEAENQEKPERSNFIEKIKSFYFKFIEILKNIKFKFQDICDKLKKVGNNITYYKDLLQSELGTKSIKKVKKSIFRILKSIRPRKFEIALEIGTGDPASTGKVLGIAGMLYPVFENHIRITPYFDEEVFKGKIYLRGHITIATLVLVACKLYFDKNLRAFIRLLKKEEK